VRHVNLEVQTAFWNGDNIPQQHRWILKPKARFESETGISGTKRSSEMTANKFGPRCRQHKSRYSVVDEFCWQHYRLAVAKCSSPEFGDKAPEESTFIFGYTRISV